jgi:multisubunit Na+/H+ antiporter MnhC subunit
MSGPEGDATWMQSATREHPMPIETVLVVTGIIAVFGFFAFVLALGDLTSGGN